MSNIKEELTWYQLKKFCNNLTGKQLGKKVLIWGEKAGYTASGKFIVPEDYINPSGDGVEPISFYKDEPELLAEEDIIIEKGHPVLLID
jgi:hypothetical protein